MGEASRRRKGVRSSPIEWDVRPLSVTIKAIADVGLPALEIHHLLLSRGWVAVDRRNGNAIYDWPPSAPDADHEITSLILDLTGRYGLPPYRVSVVDGERVMYDSASALVADLDMIEASRCAVCKPCGSV
jgi:hypothetical protein